MNSEPFAMIPNSIIRCGDRLTHMEFRVLMNLLSWRQRTGELWVYNGIIAAAIGTTDTRRVRRVTASLVAKGVIIKLERSTTTSANSYQLVEGFFQDAGTPDTATHTPGQDDPDNKDTTAHTPGQSDPPSVIDTPGQDDPPSPGQSGPYPPDKAAHTPRTPRPIPPDKAAPQEKPIRKTNGEERLEKDDFSEKPILPLATPAETEGDPESSLQGEVPPTLDSAEFLAANNINQNYIKLVVGSPDHGLDQKDLITCAKLLKLQEGKIHLTLDPSILVPFCLKESIPFKSLFKPEKDSFRWARIQDQANPARAEIAAAQTKKHKSKNPWDAAAVESIYLAYPRKVAKGAALPAIQKALTVIKDSGQQDDPFSFLLDRVKAYATLRAGEDPKFTPYPATWFNAMRYMDDFEALKSKPKDRTSSIVIDESSIGPWETEELPELF